MMNYRKESGVVFDIQRFSIGDGPGVRTTVFLKGCNLRCRWCHNPESHLVEPEIQYQSRLCVCCGACIQACPSGAHNIMQNMHVLDREKCNRCGRCTQVCLSGALKTLGVVMDVPTVMKEVMRDKEIYGFSNGGMTFSGGEPMLQIDFLEALLLAAKENGLHTAVETAGSISYRNFERLDGLADLYLFDLKGIDDMRHKQNTGGSNRLLLDNLHRLARQKSVIVRMPLIAGVNDDIMQIQKTAEFLQDMPKVQHIELLPYHKFGENKYSTLGKPIQAFEAPSKERLNELKTILESTGKMVLVRGN